MLSPSTHADPVRAIHEHRRDDGADAFDATAISLFTSAFAVVLVVVVVRDQEVLVLRVLRLRT